MRAKPFLMMIACVCAASVCDTARTQSQSAPEVAAQQFASFSEFKLQSGAELHNCRLGYRTLGQLNAEKSNAILWPSWLGGTTKDLLEFIGPGKVVDSTKYFAILVDSIGNGISTSPSNNSAEPLMKFPKFTIRDMVESERRLLTEVFQLNHLRAVIGISMGGMQTFEWAVAYPDFMDLTIPMLGSPQSTSYDKLLWTSEIDSIQLDPAWNNGNPTGPLTRAIALLEEIDSMNLTSPAYRATHTKTDQFGSFLEKTRKSASGDAGVACNMIRQREAILSHDIPREFGLPLDQIAKRVRSKMLVIVSPEDHMVNPGPAVDFAEAFGAPVIRLDSPCGHLSLSCISVGPAVEQFLDNPASVRGKTLKDAGNP